MSELAIRIHTWLPSQSAQASYLMPEKPVDKDAVEMQAVARGNEAAFARIIDRWKRPLINFFYRNTHNVGDSEDLAQMVFIRLYRAAPRYQPTAKFSTYLFQIARRLLLNQI